MSLLFVAVDSYVMNQILLCLQLKNSSEKKDKKKKRNWWELYLSSLCEKQKKEHVNIWVFFFSFPADRLLTAHIYVCWYGTDLCYPNKVNFSFTPFIEDFIALCIYYLHLLLFLHKEFNGGKELPSGKTLGSIKF